jgi:hypothetical protein
MDQEFKRKFTAISERGDLITRAINGCQHWLENEVRSYPILLKIWYCNWMSKRSF